MKKVVLSLLAVAAVGVAQAQEVKFGPKAGLNISNMSTSIDYDSNVSFHVGAVVEAKITDKFSIQPEVLYSVQGVKDVSIEYVSVPVLAKYFVTPGFSVEVGPQVSFLAKAEKDVLGLVTVDTKELYNSVDFGLNFGVAYDLPSGPFVNARYNLGLTDVYKSNISSAKHGVFQVGVGYKF